jgi:hypothetical protein
MFYDYGETTQTTLKYQYEDEDEYGHKYIKYIYENKLIQNNYYYRRTKTTPVYGGFIVIRAHHNFNMSDYWTDYPVTYGENRSLYNLATPIYASDVADDLTMELINHQVITTTVTEYAGSSSRILSKYTTSSDTSIATYSSEETIELSDGSTLYLSHIAPYTNLSISYERDQEDMIKMAEEAGVEFIGFFGFYNTDNYPGWQGNVWEESTHYSSVYDTSCVFRIQYSNGAYNHISAAHDIFAYGGLIHLNFGHDVAAIDTGETSNYIFYGGEYYEDVSDDDFDPEAFPFKVSSDGYMYATQLIKLDATSEEDVTINRVSITPLTANTLKLATVKVDGESNDICMQRIQPLIIPQGIPIAKIKYNGQDEIILVAPLSGVSSVQSQSNEEV